MVGRGARRRRRRSDQHRVQGSVPAPPTRRLGLAGGDRASGVRGSRRGGGRRPARPRTRRDRRQRRVEGAARCRRHPPRRSAVGSRHVRLHRRHDRPVEGLHAQPQLPRRARPQIGICWQRTADDVVWTPLPLFHYNALVTAVLGALVFGGRGAIERRFSVSNFWPEMNRVGATITSTLGTMAYLLAHDVDRPEMPGSGAPEANTTLRLIGAAPLPVEIDTRCGSASASTRSAARSVSPKRASCRGSRPACATSPTRPA